MTVTATNWISNSFLAVETLLANCAMFRTLMGAADVAAARTKCYWQDTRLAWAAPGTLLQIRSGSEGQSNALRVVQHTDALGAYLVWTPQAVVGDPEKEAFLRELNSFGVLLDQIETLIGTTTYLTRAHIEWEPPARTPDKGARAGCIDATITFRWEI